MHSIAHTKKLYHFLAFCANIAIEVTVENNYAIFSAISIICVNVFCLSSAVVSSPVKGQSEIVQIASAFLPV